MTDFNTQSIYSVFADTAARRGDHTAVIYLGQRFSYSRVRGLAEAFAASLAGLGVTAGQKVMLYIPNSIQWVVAWLGIQRIGAVAVPITPIYTPHDITYIAPRNEIMLEREMDEGEVREVAMHDGSVIVLKNLEKGYDTSSRYEALRVMEEAQQNGWLLTGLLYIDTTKPTLTQMYDLVDTPLNRLTEVDLRPDRSMIDKVNALMF